MPHPEQGGGKGPQRQKGRAVPPQPPEPQPQENDWYRAARYADEPAAGRAYFQVQDTIYQQESDISAYRMQLKEIYHVAVLGGAETAAALQAQIETILYAEGTPTQLPEEVLVYLTERKQQAREVAPWVEGHYRPGKVVDLRKKKRKR